MIYEPREDSYLLQKHIKDYVKNKSVLDLGTGSGILAEEALKHQARPVMASDISPEVIKHLKNKFKHNKNVKIIKSNLFSNMGNSVDCVALRQNSPDRDFGTKSNKTNQNLCIKHKFDVIIFNPPYLPQDEREDKESQQVTTGGKQGDEIILKFLKQAKSHLNNGGTILLVISSLTPKNKINFLLKKLNYKSRIIDTHNLFMEELELWEIRN